MKTFKAILSVEPEYVKQSVFSSTLSLIRIAVGVRTPCRQSQKECTAAAPYRAVSSADNISLMRTGGLVIAPRRDRFWTIFLVWRWVRYVVSENIVHREEMPTRVGLGRNLASHHSRLQMVQKFLHHDWQYPSCHERMLSSCGGQPFFLQLVQASPAHEIDCLCDVDEGNLLFSVFFLQLV